MNSLMHYVYIVLAICYFMLAFLKYDAVKVLTDNYVVINVVAGLAYTYAAYAH